MCVFFYFSLFEIKKYRHWSIFFISTIRYTFFFTIFDSIFYLKHVWVYIIFFSLSGFISTSESLICFICSKVHFRHKIQLLNIVIQTLHCILSDREIIWYALSPLRSLSVCVCMTVCAGLTQAEQAVLVEVLVASVRQASEGPALAGRSGAKKVSGTCFLTPASL